MGFAQVKEEAAGGAEIRSSKPACAGLDGLKSRSVWLRHVHGAKRVASLIPPYRQRRILPAWLPMHHNYRSVGQCALLRVPRPLRGLLLYLCRAHCPPDSPATHALTKNQQSIHQRRPHPHNTPLGVQARDQQLFHVKHLHFWRQGSHFICRMFALHGHPDTLRS